MGTLHGSEIILQGFPNTDTQDASASSIQYMHLEMTNDVLEKLLESTRLGKPPRLQFGPTPTLRFNNETIVVTPRPSHIEHEIYGNKENDLEYVGSVSHRLILQTAQETLKASDAAVEQLHQQMTDIKHEWDAKKTMMTPEMHPIKGKAAVKSSSAKPANSSSIRANKSQPPSKSVSRPTGSVSQAAQTEEDTFADATTSIKYVLVHLLAVDRFDIEQISKKLRLDPDKFKTVLQKIAEEADETGSYKLIKKSYKELDPYAFPYENDTVRQSAITNAIRAFDSMRIDPHDDAWQILLPEAERHQGKTLSKLQLRSGKDVLTPSMRPVTIDKKTGMPKRPDVKKEKAKKPADSQKAEKPTDKRRPESTKSPRETATSKDIKKPAQGRGATVAENARRMNNEKPSTAAKALLNKPKNPSPLAASPVNASDFEDNHPVHRTLAASPTKGLNGNLPNLKRKAGDMTPSKTIERPLSKQPRLESSVRPPPPKQKVIPPSSKPAQKRKGDDSHEQDSTPPRKTARDMNSTSTNRPPSTVRPHTETKKVRPPPPAASVNKTSSSYNASYSRSMTSDSSSPDGRFTLTARQRVELAMKFKRYYAQYQKLYAEVQQAKDAVSPAKLEEFWKQHNKIAEMKEQLADGVLRQ